MPDPNPTDAGPPVHDAATLVVVRDAAAGIEVFCVERKKGGFLGGAVVFPGGRLEPGDLEPAWTDASTAPRPASAGFAADGALLRGLAVAACRETLEEAALLPVAGASLDHAKLLSWRSRIASGGATLRALLSERGLKADLGALHPLVHWITPATESRRFDTRFFLWVAGVASRGEHDRSEVTDSFWATPAELLRRFQAGSIQLAPPTQRTLTTLAGARTSADAVAIAARSCLDPILPKIVVRPGAGGDAPFLVLPGDPEHDVREVRCPGPTRFVFRDGRFQPVEPPP